MSTITADPPAERAPRRPQELVELLSSMRFAIALLTVICIASVIGTVLKQHEPMPNYVNQFGPFWAQLFLAVHLDAVYSAWWFLLILAFLVVSTSLCIARNAPKILADLKTYKENIREGSLLAFHHRAEARLADPPETEAQRIGQALARGGWKVRLQQRSNGWMVAARTGGLGKIGYVSAHSAIVLVCLGGLLDGDLVVRAQMLWGGKQPYNGGGLISQVSAQHRLASTNPAFRGNLMVAEGTASSTAVLNQSDGILLQELPFSIELKKFVVEYYSAGMPKLFASDIVIHDRDTGESFPARVEVNHPVSHRGVQIYQSSFDDGGSSVTLKAVPLDGSGHGFDVQGTIGGSTELTRGPGGGAQKMTLEYTALRVINVENLGGNEGSGTDVRKVDLKAALDARLGAANKPDAKKKLRNVGPSITYKLRDASGQAREFHNYMLPVDLGDGAPVFLLGMREAADDTFRYMRIPADDKGSMDGFLRLRAALADPAMREAAVRAYAKLATDPSRPELAQQLTASTLRALSLFAGAEGGPGKSVGGLQAVSEFIDGNVPEAERPRAGEVLVRILNGALFELMELSREKAGLAPLPRDEHAQAFVTQSVLALSDAFAYPAPMAFELQDFKQVQASVFQVTRSPGHYIVYLGCALLILGVFAMLYVRERRLWVWLSPAEEGSQARMALSANRKLLDVDREFDKLRDRLLGDRT
ncbi:cytochrome c biogenesis protein ResB [Ramlibacter ginsenosidimutans]|uniref:Cytochrome c biogenesis protein ResB n=1 Tax=Ramlibacter ginsenosidimutans TaxID=502333 RepID=A0A934WL31_9BURK|nr:cytochrome c biogenesis protein ResB [Ramlibacter ginsenosidimutans]MBK6004682.1 cytochrome c biogenesis protein ResB [Ramlibacter ginsenosidimutans]